MSARISIARQGKRLALNIESASDAASFAAGYYPTAQSESFVEEIARASQHGGGAHALFGAYGAGKSSLVLFAMNQLSAKTRCFSHKPMSVKSSNLKRLATQVRGKGGLLTIAVVGASVPLPVRIIEGAKRALIDYNGSTPPPALKKIASQKPEVSPGRLLSLMADLVDQSARHRKAGVLLIVDEFGRHLERIVETHDFSDLHLAQELAEMAGGRKSAFSMLIVQHYDMEHYLRRSLTSHKGEWEKVQGRFSKTVLENTESDVARIVERIFKCKDSLPRKEAALASRSIKSEQFFSQSGDDFSNAALQCWPLHPTTLVALSKLSAYLGQKDRTVTSWMTSGLESGFKYAAETSKGWVYPASLYRYFFDSQGALPSNPVWSRRMADIMSAEERFDGDLNALVLLRTIGILNFIGGGASESLLKCCLPERFSYRSALRSLLEKSLIIYRKHRGEYCIWQGSDYDIAGAIASEIGKAANFSLSEELNRPQFLPEISANVHYLETGNDRAMPVQFMNQGQNAPVSSGHPRLLIWLQKGEVQGDCINSIGKHDVYGSLSPDRLAPLAQETSALRNLLASDVQLQQDVVARGEVMQMLDSANDKIANLISYEVVGAMRPQSLEVGGGGVNGVA